MEIMEKHLHKVFMMNATQSKLNIHAPRTTEMYKLKRPRIRGHLLMGL